MAAVPNSIPSAVVSSTDNSVEILTKPQLKPRIAPTGNSRVNSVPVTREQADAEIPAQPLFHSAMGTGGNFNAGSEGAPSVPGMGGVLFTSPPIDTHYISEAEVRNPTRKINNPATRGMQTWVKFYQNHIAQSAQNVDPNGFRTMPDQQRQSVMRITTPPHGIGYAPEIFEPRQLPQRDRSYQYNPSVGTGPFGAGTPTRTSRSVLNSQNFGAGQTAGGIGGNNYTPQPGPPPTNSTAGSDSGPSGMPTWG